MVRRVSRPHRFATDTGGSIAIKFALCLPAIALISLGAIDLNAVLSAKSRLQDIADSAALAGAQNLTLLDGAATIARTEAFVSGQLADWTGAPDVTDTVTIDTVDRQRVIRVGLVANRPSFFGNLLPPGGWILRADAAAMSVGMTPLCVLVTGGKGDKALNVKDNGRLQAPACMVHSNRDILVEGGIIRAAFVQAVKSAGGVISPRPGPGAAPIPDPFLDLPLPEKQPCADKKVKEQVDTGVIWLDPGIHCDGYKMGGTARLALRPGEHWFLGGHLEIKEDAELHGRDVVLFFDKQSKFDFKDRATVNLDGRQSGPYAGMVMVGTRGNTQDFIITSDHVESLLGVLYVPEARLIIEGKSEVARDSAWTVIVARELQLKGSPSLIVNANYDAAAVPVPEGVGPRPGKSQLIE